MNDRIELGPPVNLDRGIMAHEVDAFMTQLAALFAAEPKLKRIVFYWQPGGYDDNSFYGGNGSIEWETDGGTVSVAELAANKELAALAWPFERCRADLAGEFSEDSETPSCVAVGRNLVPFLFEDKDLLDDPDEWLCCNDIEDAGEMIRPVVAGGQLTGHGAMGIEKAFAADFADVIEFIHKTMADQEECEDDEGDRNEGTNDGDGEDA